MNDRRVLLGGKHLILIALSLLMLFPVTAGGGLVWLKLRRRRAA